MFGHILEQQQALVPQPAWGWWEPRRGRTQRHGCRTPWACSHSLPLLMINSWDEWASFEEGLFGCFYGVLLFFGMWIREEDFEANGKSECKWDNIGIDGSDIFSRDNFCWVLKEVIRLAIFLVSVVKHCAYYFLIWALRELSLWRFSRLLVMTVSFAWELCGFHSWLISWHCSIGFFFFFLPPIANSNFINKTFSSLKKTIVTSNVTRLFPHIYFVL